MCVCVGGGGGGGDEILHTHTHTHYLVIKCSSEVLERCHTGHDYRPTPPKMKIGSGESVSVTGDEHSAGIEQTLSHWVILYNQGQTAYRAATGH